MSTWGSGHLLSPLSHQHLDGCAHAINHTTSPATPTCESIRACGPCKVILAAPMNLRASASCWDPPKHHIKCTKPTTPPAYPDVDVVMCPPEHPDGGEACDEVLSAHVHLSSTVHLTTAQHSTAASRSQEAEVSAQNKSELCINVCTLLPAPLNSQELSGHGVPPNHADSAG